MTESLRFIVSILALAGVLGAGIKEILYWVWFWQAKEYRLDRFWAGLRLERFSFWHKGVLPEFTLRVKFILSFSFFVFLSLGYFWWRFFWFETSVFFLGLPVIYLMTLIIVAGGVWLTKRGFEKIIRR